MLVNDDLKIYNFNDSHLEVLDVELHPCAVLLRLLLHHRVFPTGCEKLDDDDDDGDDDVDDGDDGDGDGDADDDDG